MSQLACCSAASRSCILFLFFFWIIGTCESWKQILGLHRLLSTLNQSAWSAQIQRAAQNVQDLHAVAPHAYFFSCDATVDYR